MIDWLALLAHDALLRRLRCRVVTDHVGKILVLPDCPATQALMRSLETIGCTRSSLPERSAAMRVALVA